MATKKKTTVAKEDAQLALSEAEGVALPSVDGFLFRWVNLGARSKLGWHRTIWKPVTRDSDIGQKVLKFFDSIQCLFITGMITGNCGDGFNHPGNTFFIICSKQGIDMLKIFRGMYDLSYCFKLKF